MAELTALLTDQHRKAQLTLRAVVLRDLLKLWPALDVNRLDETFPAWSTAVGTLVQRDRARSAGLASAYLRAFRSAVGLSGEAVIVLADPAPAEQVLTSLRVTSLIAVKQASKRGVAADLAMRTAFVSTSGAASRLVLDAGRDTVQRSLAADPKAEGWRRVVSGKGCAFCHMLAGRGSVYRADTSTFQSHDHCSCTAEPVYR